MNLYMTEIVVRDTAASARWYCDNLGLVPLHEDAGFMLLQGAGGGRLALKAGTPQPGGVRLHFEVANLDEEVARLAARGVAPASPVKVSPEGYRRVVLADPDGHAVVLFAWTGPQPLSNTSRT